MSEKTLSWCEISGKPSEFRYQTLSKYLNEKGFSNTFVPITATHEDFEKVLVESTKKYDQIRVGPPFGERLLELYPNAPVNILPVRSADCLFQSEGRWWPRSMLMDAFLEQVKFLKNIDLSAAALVVGVGSAARAIVGSLIRIGFKRISITDFDLERGEKTAIEIQKNFFNVKIQFLEPPMLTGLPGIHSIVVNATPLSDENHMLQDLYYFNFLILGGIAIDLNFEPIETPFLKMAHEVGARIVHGWEIAALSDLVWSRMALKQDLGLEYRECIESALKSRSSV